MSQSIAVIGGTGKAGRFLVTQLLSEGYRVRLLTRHPEKNNLQHPFLEIIAGDAGNFSDIVHLLTGCRAVLSALGQDPGAPPVFTSSTENVLRAMKTNGQRRYIVLTGLSIDVPGDEKGPAAAQASAYMRNKFPETIAAKQQEYDLLAKSTLDWTVVRVPLIEQSGEQGRLLISRSDCPGGRITAGSIARFLIDQLTSADFIREAPFISNEPA